MTTTLRGAALAAALVIVVLLAPAAFAQATPAVSVSPTSGPGGSAFTIRLANYHACDPNDPNSAGKCVIIDFVQGSTTITIGKRPVNNR